MSGSPLAFLTAATAMGGYPMPPKSWMKLTSTWIWQMVAIFILVWQSGHVPLLTAIIIGILVFHLILVWKLAEDKFMDSEKKPKETYMNPKYFDGSVKVKT